MAGTGNLASHLPGPGKVMDLRNVSTDTTLLEKHNPLLHSNLYLIPTGKCVTTTHQRSVSLQQRKNSQKTKTEHVMQRFTYSGDPRLSKFIYATTSASMALRTSNKWMWKDCKVQKKIRKSLVKASLLEKIPNIRQENRSLDGHVTLWRRSGKYYRVPIQVRKYRQLKNAGKKRLSLFWEEPPQYWFFTVYMPV